ncbi:hypothetical protein ACFXAF_00605 [Kitasatospora sp. NPDC059463]|uniref:hypothetical protein n=1 Tax=unclassified Kitasatospora TaxID=2633591 RepID=UPI0036A14CE2
MIDRERAIGLVESYLESERPAAGERPAGPGPGPGPERVVHAVEEHEVGWLVFWGPSPDDRARSTHDRPVGGHSHVLVDRYDGSLHYVAEAWWQPEGWEDHYLLQTKGVRRPDPLAAEVRALVRSAGVVAAMRELRRRAPRLGLPQARAYITAVRDGAEPPEDLAALTRKEPLAPFWPVDTLAGPVT